MKTFIIGGGYCDRSFVEKTIQSVAPEERLIIACDRGAEVCLSIGIMPDFCVGDFDSAKEGLYEELLEKGIEVKKLNPIKDDTDAEAALSYAYENTKGKIYFLCGTGTRLDHVLGNISLLGQGLNHGRCLYLLDATNKIYMLGPGSKTSINRETQHGKYVSLIPYMGEVTGVNLAGFKYPLKDAAISGFNTLTVSNEIVEDEASIEIGEGYLIVMETRD